MNLKRQVKCLTVAGNRYVPGKPPAGYHERRNRNPGNSGNNVTRGGWCSINYIRGTVRMLYASVA